MSASPAYPSLIPPKDFSRAVQADRLIIRRSWRKAGGLVVFILAALAWNGFAFAWFWQAGIQGGVFSFTAAFQLLFVGAGFLLIYACLSVWYNTTGVEVGPDTLRVHTGPLPWHRERRIPTAGISNVIFREHANPGYSSTYRVMIVFADGEEKSLVGRLISYEETVFYVREIRAWLKLPDVSLSPDA